MILFYFFCFLSSLFFSCLRVNNFIFFFNHLSLSFILIINEIITQFYHYMINAFHLKWDEFFFNSIQSSLECDIEEYHFSVWWILKENNHFFLIHSNETSHDKRLFSSRQRSYFQQQKSISNNDSIVNFLLSTPFHLPIIWAVNHFHLWFHHRHFKEPSNE